MVVGIGTDICDQRRVAAVLDRKGERFARKVLGPREWAVYEARRAREAGRGLAFLATRFSAKEAFAKAVGLGLHAPMTWRDCEILNHPSGQPYLQLSGALAGWFAERGWRAHVTLSDESDYVVSFVVVETLADAAASP